MTNSAVQDCPWCGQTTPVKRQVAQEDIPRLVAEFVRDLLAGGTVIADHELAALISMPAPLLPRASAHQAAAVRRSVPVPLDELEREHIVGALRQVHGNRMAAARMLGISRRALYRRIDRYQIVDDVPRFAAGRRV